MELQSNSVSQQDALCNALLAIFMILILIMIQVGMRDVDARAFERTYGREEPMDPARGGPAPLSTAVQARTVTVLTYADAVKWSPDGAEPVLGSWNNTNLEPRFKQYEGFRGTQRGRFAWLSIDPTQQQTEWRFEIANTDPGAASEVYLWLDDGRPIGAQPRPLAPNSALYVYWCKPDVVLLFDHPGGGCGR